MEGILGENEHAAGPRQLELYAVSGLTSGNLEFRGKRARHP